MPHIRVDVTGRIRAWSRRWGPLLPVLGAELIIMIGFGALLPVLPLFVQEQGIDAAQLGLIVAAWPIAKLISEPFFGWWADRHSRKPQMVAGLIIFAVVSLLPVFFTTFAAQFVLRFLAGAAIGMYDPAARGMIVDATEPDERGEAFGYYGAFQVGGFVFGPAIGALGAAVFGGYAFPFVFTSVLAIVAMVVLVITLPAHPHVVEAPEFVHHPDARPTPTGMPYAGAETMAVPADPPDATSQAPLSALFNRTVTATLVLSFGLHLSFGVYEVIWSLYLVALGATVAWVGLSFVVFGIPEMIAAPIAGRWVDRKGPIPFIIVCGLAIMLAGVGYTLVSDPFTATLIVPFEAIATAAMGPALFTMLARGTPRGRASTAQGLYGAVSTLAIIVASIVAGALFEQGMDLPFWFFVIGVGVCLVLGLLIYRSAHVPSTAIEPSTAPTR
ncbi:MAG TPA: MFS transporter [Candidatus Deferrimicrobium sp.]|nr:MFS transporter [Candidatus Deferrimicrobium sp.]